MPFYHPESWHFQAYLHLWPPRRKSIKFDMSYDRPNNISPLAWVWKYWIWPVVFYVSDMTTPSDPHRWDTTFSNQETYFQMQWRKLCLMICQFSKILYISFIKNPLLIADDILFYDTYTLHRVYSYLLEAFHSDFLVSYAYPVAICLCHKTWQ